MKVTTTRFGTLEIDREAVHNIDILGFEGKDRWALFSPSNESLFVWLQCLTDPGLALVIVMAEVVPGYTVPITQEELNQLGLRNYADGQVWLIANTIDGQLTVNLCGPIIINPETRHGMQKVIPGNIDRLRVPIFTEVTR